VESWAGAGAAASASAVAISVSDDDFTIIRGPRVGLGAGEFWYNDDAAKVVAVESVCIRGT
jgi:hypothetical protein